MRPCLQLESGLSVTLLGSHPFSTCFTASTLPLWLQIGVLQWFAKLWEIDKQDYWG